MVRVLEIEKPNGSQSKALDEINHLGEEVLNGTAKGRAQFKNEFKDYAALASNDIDLIEIDRTRNMS